MTIMAMSLMLRTISTILSRKNNNMKNSLKLLMATILAFVLSACGFFRSSNVDTDVDLTPIEDSVECCEGSDEDCKKDCDDGDHEDCDDDDNDRAASVTTETSYVASILNPTKQNYTYTITVSQAGSPTYVRKVTDDFELINRMVPYRGELITIDQWMEIISPTPVQ